MSELGGYLMAKLLWNPKYDAKTARDEFLDAYYGPAAEPIAKYLDLIHDYAEKQNVHVGIYVGANSPHLTDDMLASGERSLAGGGKSRAKPCRRAATG